jgi:hypothetical protein
MTVAVTLSDVFGTVVAEPFLEGGEVDGTVVNNSGTSERDEWKYN